MSVLEESLVAAYQNTEYITDKTPLGVVTLKIGHNCTALEALYALHQETLVDGRRTAAFITAFNPYGIRLPKEQNEKRHEMLCEIISANGWVSYEGSGVGLDGLEWEPEKSFLILGITRSSAINIGTLLQQNAIVYCPESSLPELVLLR